MMTSSSRNVSDNMKYKFIIWLWITCILGTVVSEGHFYVARYGKRKDAPQNNNYKAGSTFYVHGRWGRSDGSINKDLKVVPKLFGVVPRNDGFFSNGRYGKRSSSLDQGLNDIGNEMNLKRFLYDYFGRDRPFANAANQDAIIDDNERLLDDNGTDEVPYPLVLDGPNKI